MEFVSEISCPEMKSAAVHDNRRVKQTMLLYFKRVAILAKAWIDFCQIESISECKHISHMADLLDFRLSPMMHINIKIFMGLI